MAVTLYLVRERAPGAALWSPVGGIVGADARGRAAAEAMARRRHAAAGGRLRVVVVELVPGRPGGRIVLDLPAGPWAPPLTSAPP